MWMMGDLILDDRLLKIACNSNALGVISLFVRVFEYQLGFNEGQLIAQVLIRKECWNLIPDLIERVCLDTEGASAFRQFLKGLVNSLISCRNLGAFDTLLHV
jgi:hypothetical protein